MSKYPHLTLTFEMAIIQRYQKRKISVEEALVEMYCECQVKDVPFANYYLTATVVFSNNSSSRIMRPATTSSEVAKAVVTRVIVSD